MHALLTELDAWAQADRVATFWWRDDDAIAPGAKLEKLFELTTRAGLLLAVIPASSKDALVPAVDAAKHVVVGQHGYAHINYAQKGLGLGAWELGLHRGEAAVLADIEAGRVRLEQLFASRFLPVIVPPWNRIDTALFQPIAERGFAGISLFGPRTTAPQARFVFANSHCDPIRWKGGAHFTGTEKALNQLVEHLCSRRCGSVDASEPTGILTHHIDMDEASWQFCAEVEQLISAHPATRWMHAHEVFGVLR